MLLLAAAVESASPLLRFQPTLLLLTAALLRAQKLLLLLLLLLLPLCNQQAAFALLRRLMHAHEATWPTLSHLVAAAQAQHVVAPQAHMLAAVPAEVPSP